jgi:hypothetical protein
MSKKTIEFSVELTETEIAMVARCCAIRNLTRSQYVRWCLDHYGRYLLDIVKAFPDDEATSKILRNRSVSFLSNEELLFPAAQAAVAAATNRGKPHLAKQFLPHVIRALLHFDSSTIYMEQALGGGAALAKATPVE